MPEYPFWWFHRIEEALRLEDAETREWLLGLIETLKVDPLNAPPGIPLHVARGRARSSVEGDVRLIAELPDGWRLTYSIGRLPPPLGGPVIKLESLLRVIEGDRG